MSLENYVKINPDFWRHKTAPVSLRRDEGFGSGWWQAYDRETGYVIAKQLRTAIDAARAGDDYAQQGFAVRTNGRRR